MQTNRTDVSVLGAGPMGAALVRTLITGGAGRVTVWNRTPAKAEALRESGAVVAPSAAAAVAASPIVLLCINDYATARALLETAGALDGRFIVQMTTGTPQDARDLESWTRQRGGAYLDAAIMAMPSQMGRRDTLIFVAGSRDAYQRAEATLKILAGGTRHLGEQVGLASTYDLGILSSIFGALFGFLHGVRVFESEGKRGGDLGNMIAAMAPAIGEMIKHAGDRIDANDYANPESTVKTCAVAFELFARQAREGRINAEFAEFTLHQARRVLAAGHGEEDFAAMIKGLRD